VFTYLDAVGTKSSGLEVTGDIVDGAIENAAPAPIAMSVGNQSRTVFPTE